MSKGDSAEALLGDLAATDFDADGNPDLAPGDVSPAVAARYKCSLHISWVVCVLCFVDLSIVSPTLYPYVAKMCGSTGMYGWLVVVYSLAQVIGSPLFSVWAVKRSVKEAMLVSVFLMIAGNLLYALVAFTLEPTCNVSTGSACVPMFLTHNITTSEGHSVRTRSTLADLGLCGSDKHHTLVMLFIARALAGLGGGSVAVAFGLFPRVTTLKDRVFTYSCARTYMAVAYMLSPGLAAVFAVAACDCDGGVLHGSAYVNQFTLPGYVTAAAAAFTFVLICWKFKEPPEVIGGLTVKVFFHRGLLMLILSSFVAAFVVGAFSAILVPVTSNNYGWTDVQNSLFYVGVGFLLIPGSTLAMVLAKCFGHKNTILISSCMLAAGLFMDLIPTHQVSFTGNAKSLSTFILGSFLICTGYSAVTAICPATFSLLIPNTHKQAMMGWIPTLGGLARTLGPLYGVQTYDFAKRMGGLCPDDLHYDFFCGDRFTEVSLGVLVLLVAFLTWLIFEGVEKEAQKIPKDVLIEGYEEPERATTPTLERGASSFAIVPSADYGVVSPRMGASFRRTGGVLVNAPLAKESSMASHFSVTSAGGRASGGSRGPATGRSARRIVQRA